MGVRLIVEILDHWQDVGLTAGERNDLIVLAENANDNTRHTWGPVHASYILKRANKSAPSWRISINKLMKKKALEYAQREGKELRGRTGQHAVYRIAELCPDAPHDGYQGHCTRPERVTGGVTQPDDGEGYPSDNPVGEPDEEGYLTANPEGYPSDNPVDGEGYLTDTEWVSGELTPSPPCPSSNTSSNTPSSSAADDEPETGGGGGDLSSKEDDENDGGPSGAAAAFVKALDYRGKPPGEKRRATLTRLVRAALAAGWSEDGLRRYLDISDDPSVRNAAAVYAHRLAEGELPDAAAEASSLPPACPECLAESPAAEYNAGLRWRDGRPCWSCHPNPQMTGQHLTGTDATVLGWAALAGKFREREEAEHMPTAWLRPPTTTSRQQQETDDWYARSMARARARSGAREAVNGHQPYNGDDWRQIDAQGRHGIAPEGSDKHPHCGDTECDDTIRMREEDDANGLPYLTPCPKCHPALKF